MISFNGIHKSFGDQVLFDDITFSMHRRERVGLVGRNGHGKTTLLRMITGEESMDAGEIVVPKRYRIGYLEQHIAFTKPTVVEEAALGLPEGHRDEHWRVEKVLSGLGFSTDDMERPPEIFSGGFQVRLNLAKVLVSEPDLLLLDEPTNYLDVVSIRWLARFLRAWPSELILVTHDRSFMDQVVTHTVGIHRRRAKKIEGDTGKLYDQILQEEEVYEKTRMNDEKRRKEIQRFIDRFRAKNSLATRVQSRIRFLEKHERKDALDDIQTLDFAFNSAPFSTKVMMRIEDLAFSYEGGPTLFSKLGFEIQAHDRICVIGQNGKGKSTLLRLLAGKLTPVRGSIAPHPQSVVGHFDQTNVETLHPGNTVASEIQGADDGCLPQTARNVAGAMMFEGDNALKHIEVLSGGEKARVMLGKLIVSPCNLLLLDEPTNHLDMDSSDSLLAAIDAFPGAVVIVTHNEMFLRSLATRFVIFDRGRVRLFDHSYQDFLDKIGWELDESLGGREGARRPSMDKKALRQARAKLLQERSRAVGPLEEKVETTEQHIMQLEADLEKELDAMSEASVSGETSVLARHTRRHADLKHEIEKLYADLEKASEALERASAEWDERFDAIQ